MTPFAALKRFFSPRVTGPLPTTSPWIVPDVEGTAHDLNLREQARERGSRELPASDDESFDAVESSIISLILDQHRNNQIEYRNDFAAYEERIADLKLLNNASLIKAETISAIGDFQVEVYECRNNVEIKKQEIIDSNIALREFKKSNGLTRPPNLHENRIIPIGFIISALLIESVLNAVFLSSSARSGLAGGFIAALAIAAINVGISFVGGWGPLRNLQVRKTSVRTLNSILVVVWVTVLASWNLLAGHYRDAREGDFDNPEIAALDLFVESPFLLDSIYSYGLFAIGTIAAIVASGAGYSWDDPFPRYGHLGREFSRRCRQYSKEIEDTNGRLAHTRNTAIREARAVKTELVQQYQERSRLIAWQSRLSRNLVEHEGRLEQTARHLLAIYRDENKAARQTDVPRHFRSQWELPRTEIEESVHREIRKDDIEAAEVALDKSIDELSAEFQNSIRSFATLEELNLAN